MKLFHSYQSRNLQFSLDAIAALQRQKSLTIRELNSIALHNGLSYANQVLRPLCQAHILEHDGHSYHLGEEFKSFELPMGQIESDYLQYILQLPEASLFLQEQTINKLRIGDGEVAFFEPIERFDPEGSELPPYPGPEGFRNILRAIRQKRLIRYEFRTKDDTQWRDTIALPWKLEYSAYDRRWWIILYIAEQDRTVKARLENLKNIHLEDMASVPEKVILQAVDKLLAPEPMVLEVERSRGALERCFMVFENQLFVRTKQISEDRFRLAFQYYRFDESELLRRLLFLGPMVTLIEPFAVKQKLVDLIEQALEL